MTAKPPELTARRVVIPGSQVDQITGLPKSARGSLGGNRGSACEAKPCALDRLTPQQVRAIVNRKLQDGLAPKTVLSILALLRNALTQAERWGLVSRNVASLVDPPRSEQAEIQPLTLKEARILLEAAKSGVSENNGVDL